MKMITPRLQMIIDLVSEKTIADIGTDHAYIPIKLASMGQIEKAIATDKNEGPLKIAEENVFRYGLSDKVSLRLGSGLDPINEGECELLIIAGMGGKLIGDIIEDNLSKSKSFKLLLQPMNAQAELRKRLINLGFKITKESLSCEGFKVYNAFCCERGKQKLPEEKFLHIPLELSCNKYYNMLVDKKIRELNKIIKGLENAKTPDYSEIDYYKNLLGKIENMNQKGL
ncbi:MAG: SAM-dependent methyltransferase [Clostridia bacterium]|nr:SAM-dependent methyltransferase [Clostridia bacterium]